MSEEIFVVILTTIFGLFAAILGFSLNDRNPRQENRTRESSQNAQPSTSRNPRQENRTRESWQNAQPSTSRNPRQENRTRESSQNAQPLTARNPRQENRTRESSQNVQFEVLEKLGKGGFGAVYKARDKNGKMFAFKFITSPSVKVTKREQIPLLHWNENIINIHGVWNLTNRNNETIHVPSDVDMPVFAIQLELCDNTLYGEIYEGYKVRNSEWKFAIFKQILDGVGYLHKNEIIHRDLKPQNILFKDGIIKITDFSLAKEKVLNELYAHTGGIGSLTYWAPEQRNGSLYNKKVDVFSLGIIWAEIWVASGHKIKHDVFLNWASKLPLSFTMDQNVPQNIQTMILKMTEVNPNNRFSTSESRNQLSLFNSSKQYFC